VANVGLSREALIICPGSEVPVADNTTMQNKLIFLSIGLPPIFSYEKIVAEWEKLYAGGDTKFDV
jgi:hypothetical protein